MKIMQNRTRVIGIVFLLLIGVFIVVFDFNNHTMAEPTRTNGNVALYHFNEGTGTNVTDSSDYGNDGIIHNATWTDGISGNALNFDGVDDYVEIADDDSLDLTTGATLEAWVKTNTLTDCHTIFAKRNDKGEHHRPPASAKVVPPAVVRLVLYVR